MQLVQSEVAENVRRVEVLTPTLPPATHTNSYALGGRELLLVEPATPYPEEQRQWLEWARSLVSQGRQAQAILLTHHHPDHVGGAEVLSRELGLPLWAHQQTAARLGDLTIDRLLDDGDSLVLDGAVPQRWRFLHTPGHAPGHLCLLESELKVALVGDMVASVGTILIDPYDGDMVAYLAQLNRLAELDLSQALPAHGAPIVDPQNLFRHYIAHRLAREFKVAAALSQLSEEHDRNAGSSLDDLLPLAYVDTPTLLWPLARLSLEAHLIKLVADGAAQRVGKGRWHWLGRATPG